MHPDNFYCHGETELMHRPEVERSGSVPWEWDFSATTSFQMLRRPINEERWLYLQIYIKCVIELVQLKRYNGFWLSILFTKKVLNHSILKLLLSTAWC